jgi:predicted RNase H-like HicB family nuclease
MVDLTHGVATLRVVLRYKQLTILWCSVNTIVFGVVRATGARGAGMASRDQVLEILNGFDFTMKYRQTASGWWIAYCEELPEARTQGETKDEVRENLTDAITFILEDYSVEELQRLRNKLVSEERELLAL